MPLAAATRSIDDGRTSDLNQNNKRPRLAAGLSPTPRRAAAESTPPSSDDDEYLHLAIEMARVCIPWFFVVAAR